MIALNTLPNHEVKSPAWRIERPLPPELGTCLLVHGFLSPAQCLAIIATAEQRGFRSAEADYPPSYRNNDRQVIDDPALGERLMQGLRGLAPASIFDDDAGRSAWRLDSLNQRIRLCRYLPGQRFGIHQDGVHHRGTDCRSRLTFMIYLTDGEAFEGGDTLFYASGPGTGANGAPPPVLARVRPRAGSLILFDHGIWHAGEEVSGGIKHILRSDLLYRREAGPPGREMGEAFAPGHEGYVWTLARTSDGGLLSGGRDSRIRIWDGRGVLRGTLNGHTQSVLGLAELSPGRIASVSRDRSLRLWDLASQACTHNVVAHQAAVLALARVAPDCIATGSADHRIALWNTRGESRGVLEGHEGWVWALASMAPGQCASASEDGSARLWDINSGRCLARLAGAEALRSLDVMPDPDRAGLYLLATGDVAGHVRLWRVGGGFAEPAGAIRAHAAAVRRVRFLANGSLATCGEDNRLRLWRADDQAPLAEVRRDNFVTDVAELADGRLLSCGYDGRILPCDKAACAVPLISPSHQSSPHR